MSLLLPLLALAAGPVNCADPATQTDMNICSEREYAAADAELNAQWRITADIMRVQDRDPDLRTDSRPGYFQVLLTGQRAWLQFRDAHCTMEGYGARGGSIEPMLVSGCKRELTEERTKQLRAIADYPN